MVCLGRWETVGRDEGGERSSGAALAAPGVLCRRKGAGGAAQPGTWGPQALALRACRVLVLLLLVVQGLLRNLEPLIRPLRMPGALVQGVQCNK
jgi:hypothetical protein